MGGLALRKPSARLTKGHGLLEPPRHGSTRLVLGGSDFSNLFVTLKNGAKAAGPYASYAEAKAAGAVTLGYGAFVTQVVQFLILAWVVFTIQPQNHVPSAETRTLSAAPASSR